MENKVILVTGSTDGIGKQTALGLASMAAQVNLHGRDLEKAHAVLEEIRYKNGNYRLAYSLRISHLKSRSLDWLRTLHVLINNAGTFMRERKLTEDGIEMTFAVNYMAPFILTSELLGLLKESASSRIINVASVAHWNAKIDWNNLQGERGYDGFQAYALSKLGIILFTYTLAKRLNGTGVTVNCLHPGVTKTKLLRSGFGDYPGADPQKRCGDTIYLASAPEVEI